MNGTVVYRLWSGVFLMAAALGWLAAGCAQTRAALPIDIPSLLGPRASDEEIIAAVLDDVHRGMQSRQIYKVLAHVSRTYQDSEGRDYAAMQEYLNSIFKNYRNIRIDRMRPRILVEGQRARAVETFGTVAEPMTGSPARPISLQGQVTVYLEKSGDTWKITEWGRML